MSAAKVRWTATVLSESAQLTIFFLSRAAIAFDSLADLADCLECSIRDPCVVVERVKNRLDPSFDAATISYGYRDVLVNLRLVRSPVGCLSDASWIKLGLSSHVCEIQLVPLEIFRLKTEFGHKRYVLNRNLKAA